MKGAMSRFLLFCLFLFSLPVMSAEKPIIISGFDDVLRQAESTSLWKEAVKLTEEDKNFGGMPELYDVVSKQESDPKFYVVSGMTSWLTNRVESFLKTAKYPSHKIYLRNWLKDWSIENFKIAKIKEILANKPNRKFIVIFDNSNASSELADLLREEFPSQIVAIYLRQVVKSDVPSSGTPFYTPFDIALHELAAQRMTIEEAKLIGEVVFNEHGAESMFPSYALCPTNYDFCKSAPKELEEVCGKVVIHLQAVCKAR